jgi:hypothetical protein
MLLHLDRAIRFTTELPRPIKLETQGSMEKMKGWAEQNTVLLGLNAAVLVCVAITWLLYVLFGHRLIEAIYGGPSVEFLHKIMMMEGQSILPLEHYFRGAKELMWSATVIALSLCSAFILVLKAAPRITVTVLTPIFVLFSLSVSGIAFIYPLEIETRESTVWLHILAIRHGLNIYDHAQLAFINQNHGPFDPLFKLSVATIFPFLEPWHVARFSVLLLPYAFLIVAWKLAGKLAQRSFLGALYLGALGYLFLVISAKEFIFVGRSDATAALLLIPLTYLSMVSAPRTWWHSGLRGVIWGVLGIAVILSNWRMVPVVFALLIFSVWRFRYHYQTAFRAIAIYLTGCACAFSAVFAPLLFQFFAFDLSLYYKHFFGVYSQSSGHGHATYAHAPAVWFLGSLLKPTASPESLKGGPVLLALSVYLLVPRKGSLENRAWFLLGVFIFAACTAAYYLNYYGGGQWYYIPFLIVLWFFLCGNYSAISRSRFAALGLLTAVFLMVNFNTVVAPSLWRLSTLRAAHDFMDRVRMLQQDTTILSEDMFFFRTTYGGELIDMGDMVSKIRKQGDGYYGDAFNRTVDAHFERLQKDPPDYIVTGFTESAELRKLIQESYVQVGAGPNNLTANGRGESRLFKRKNLTTEKVDLEGVNTSP